MLLVEVWTSRTLLSYARNNVFPYGQNNLRRQFSENQERSYCCDRQTLYRTRGSGHVSTPHRPTRARIGTSCAVCHLWPPHHHLKIPTNSPFGIFLPIAACSRASARVPADFGFARRPPYRTRISGRLLTVQGFQGTICSVSELG